MPITDSQLKGNWGEQFVASQLSSQGCFIRHVTQGHDCGIDLYCEDIQDGIPNLHFWCQVKTSNEFNKCLNEASYTPEAKYREYWLRQPVPVYVFLVPDIRDTVSKHFFICNAFDLWLGKTIKSFARISQPNDLKQFLINDLALHTFIWELKSGKVGPLKTAKTSYVKTFPQGWTTNFENEILSTIRWTLRMFSSDMIVGGADLCDFLNNMKHDPEYYDTLCQYTEPYLKALETIIIGKNDRHYEDYLNLGIYYELKEEHKKAISCYRESFASIMSDPNINKNEEPWNRLIPAIKNRIEIVSGSAR